MIPRKFILPFISILQACLACDTADPNAGCYTPDGGATQPVYATTTQQWDEWTTSTDYPEPTTYYPTTTDYPEPTTYYPTTSYYSYWTSSTPYYSSYYYNGYITTVTSYLPCPTSTVIYYTQDCPDNCPTTEVNPDGGTTTLTEYTTTTPYPYETITSNGVVVVVMTTGLVQGGNVATVTAAADGSDGAALEVRFGYSIFAAGLVALVMIAL